jgi:DNA-binding NarL/FixJ family response regulator
MLPDGDGMLLLQHIRSQRLPIKVLVTTAVSDPSRMQLVQSLLPEKMLRKPIDLAELLRGLNGANTD